MRSLRHDQHCLAFTLIELLTCVAIIGVLAALLLSSISKVIAEADRAGCASGLRLVGLATLGYASDHDQMLPGPLYGGQQYTYTTGGDSGMLLTDIAAYLPVPPSSAKSQVAKPMLCPAWKRVMKDPKNTGRCFRTNLTAIMTNGKPGAPFGYKSSTSEPSQQPLRTSALKSMSATYLLADMDQINDTGYAGDSTVPKTAVHGKCHNTLFLDAHVEAIPSPTPSS